MSNCIEFRNVVKKYQNFELGPINLSIQSGTITGLIGENGAGKTTLLKSMLNLIKYDGEITIFDKDISKFDSLVKNDIAVVMDKMYFAENMMVNDVKVVLSKIYKKFDKDIYDRYLKMFNITNKPLKELSTGMHKKVEIIGALACQPKLLVLDEPTSGLDPIARKEILDLFLDFISDDSHSILLSTHITSDLEQVADHITFMNKGQIVLDKSRDDIMDNYGILKCTPDQFCKIEKSDIVKSVCNKYEYKMLVDNVDEIRIKYPEYVLDKITLEELMYIMIKGE